MKDKFKLTHVTLYAKGWYTHSDDVVSDLIRVLNLDGYSPFDKRDVLSILLSQYQKSFNVDLVDFVSSINSHNCWKVGYYTKNCEWVKDHQDLPEYDMYTAVIYTIISGLRFLSTEWWYPTFPKYSKENRRPEDISINKLYERFVKK